MSGVQATFVPQTVAEQVRDLIAAAFDAEPGYGPTLLEEWFDDRQWTVAWEHRDDWPYGISDHVTPPRGVWLEAINHYSIAIYPR